jgi:tetratricopeptide (TPR) repeat protein
MSDRMIGGAGLDESEFLHLAMHAMRSDRHDEATRLLRLARESFPASAQVLYLLGAEHAQMGLYDRAIEEMTAAVGLDPGLAAAHFQLGLLHATAGRAAEAIAAWAPLDELQPEDPLRLFKTAMAHLLNDELPQSIAALRAGLAHEELNEALRRDMQRLLTDLEQRQSAGRRSRVGSRQTTAKVPPPTKRVLLSAYQRNSDAAPTD